MGNGNDSNDTSLPTPGMLSTYGQKVGIAPTKSRHRTGYMRFKSVFKVSFDPLKSI